MYEKLLSITAAVVLAAGGVFIFASPASGKAPIEVTGDPNMVVRHVSYADLNLASAAGEKRLNGRVKGAVRHVCKEAVGTDNGSYIYEIRMMRCDRSAWDGARPQIARAVERAHQIALTGTSSIPPVAISIVAHW